MALQINGTVKRGKDPIDGDVKLEILDNLSKVVWSSKLPVVNGSFFTSLQDVTGTFHNYKGMSLEGRVLDDETPNKDFKPEKTIIPGDKVELHFFCPATVLWRELAQRMAGAAALRSETYARIDDADDVLLQSLLVLVVSCLALGAIVGWSGGLFGVSVSTVALLIVLGGLAALMCLAGTTLLAAPATHTTLPRFLRTFGFATTPLLCVALVLVLLYAVGGSPDLLNLLLIVGMLWEVAALTVGAHQALNYRSQWGRALCVVLAPLLIMTGIIFVVIASLS